VAKLAIKRSASAYSRKRPGAPRFTGSPNRKPLELHVASHIIGGFPTKITRVSGTLDHRAYVEGRKLGTFRSKRQARHAIEKHVEKTRKMMGRG
jgi:hypothetical protein